MEGDAVKPVGGEEDTVIEDAVELKIGLELAFIEIVLRLAQLLGIEIPVPGLELKALAAALDQRLQGCRFALSGGGSGRPQLLQKGLHRLRRLRHLVIELV